MIEVRNNHVGKSVTATVRPPLLYLDHNAIIHLSRMASAAQRRRFLSILDRHGTVALSLAGLTEIANQRDGPATNSVVELLRDIGPKFVLIDVGAHEVSERSFPSRDPRKPFYDELQMQHLARRRNWRPGLLSAEDAVVELLEEPIERRRELATLAKAGFVAVLERARERFRDDGWDPRLARGQPLALVYWHRLVRVLARERAPKLHPNDGVDLLHTQTAPAVCDLVILDDAWRRRVEQVEMPPRRAAVFSMAKAGGGIDAFLDAFERWEPPPGVK